MDLHKINFWKRLEMFVENVKVNDAMSEEEKEMIIRIAQDEQNSHKPVVVRGGDFENQFVQHVGKYFTYPDLNKTPNTPTEPLATEARDTVAEARVIIEECKKRTNCGCVGECKLSYEDARKSSDGQP